MKSNTEKTFNVLFEPIDQIEEIIFAYGLESQRLDKNHLIVNLNGIWSKYELSFFFMEELSSIQLNNDLLMKIPDDLIPGLHTLISLINEKLNLGYFGYSTKRKCIYFRYNLFLKGVNQITTEQIEELFDYIVFECDRFFPAFQIFLQKRSDPLFAIDTALLETLGEA